ncbi:hypothetical protein FEF34_12415 [Streptomyces marianii]|uniref:Uncharacterized protein n=1 Tax=Streptomyces marianii TaxID=1817406 RepID=A0A5R9E262_9ACTN|nr:hypothetical protein FEF34_12415 [Streptomyces marianii]
MNSHQPPQHVWHCPVRTAPGDRYLTDWRNCGRRRRRSTAPAAPPPAPTTRPPPQTGVTTPPTPRLTLDAARALQEYAAGRARRRSRCRPMPSPRNT